jgi:hypothetical protein
MVSKPEQSPRRQPPLFVQSMRLFRYGAPTTVAAGLHSSDVSSPGSWAMDADLRVVCP